MTTWLKLHKKAYASPVDFSNEAFGNNDEDRTWISSQ
jgi:hypothetical protein